MIQWVQARWQRKIGRDLVSQRFPQLQRSRILYSGEGKYDAI